MFRLWESRPEFVYGIGIEDEHWAEATRQACQARAYSRLVPTSLHEFKRSHADDHILVDHALIHLFETRGQSARQKRILRLVKANEESPWAPYCSAVFGTHHTDLRREFFDEETLFSTNTTVGFIDLATEFVKNWQQSWLDVTGHELGPRLNLFTQPLAPTVVLVGSVTQDLSLFWNLRLQSDTGHPEWILPIPAENATSSPVLEKLREWLMAHEIYGTTSNYCHVTSQSVAQDRCTEFATQLQAVLVRTAIERVDYQPARNRLPVVTPFEYETTWPADLSGRKLTLQPPRPRAFQDLGHSRGWIVDLLKDLKTGRAIKNLQLPPGPVVFELLNGPCPPGFAHTRTPAFGDGTDSINVRCSGRTQVVTLHLPSGEEIVEEILREHGVEPLLDEKREGYFPVIARFGSVYQAAKAMSGKSGMVLEALEGEPKTIGQLKGLCRLGKDALPGKAYIDQIAWMFEHESERIKRVGRRRFAQYAKDQAPETQDLQHLLEFWADRSILTRQWRVGPCPRCHKTRFQPQLNIQKRVKCPTCGSRIILPERVPLAYALDRSVSLAIKEGVIPVVLTGRFLRGMTVHGFFWVPGVKYQMGSVQGDIDIVACCDGHLVFCECKTRKEAPKGQTESIDWDKVTLQFRETAEVAMRCGGSLVVLASQVQAYPDSVRSRIERELAGKIPHLLLNSQDLEQGKRLIDDRGHKRPQFLRDLVQAPFPEQPRPPADIPREIKFGWGGLFKR
jgi:DNA-directed RNA polymerase subunit RPC12/RpoP